MKFLSYILAFMLLVSVSASCEFGSQGSGNVNTYSLQSYAEALKHENVDKPLIMMVYAAYIQEYEKADEEGRKDSKFDFIRNNYLHIDDNTFTVNGVGTFESEGNDFFADGSVWRFHSVMSYDNVVVTDYEVTSTSSAADTSWTMTYRNEYESRSIDVILKRDAGNDTWKIMTEGNDYLKEKSMHAIFSTCNEFMTCMLVEKDGYSRLVNSGKFHVDIYSDLQSQELTDFCHTTYFADGSYISETSR